MIQMMFAQTFAVQGVLRDQYGKSLPNGYYLVTFHLYDQAEGGSAVWSETWPSLETVDGTYVAELGSRTAFNGLEFSEDYWLGIVIEESPELAPRLKLTRMPYVFTASGENNLFPSAGNVGAGTTSPDYLLHVSGEYGTYVSMNSSGSSAGINFDSNGSSEWQMKINSGDGTLHINEDSGTDAVSLKSGGRIGIGTGSPSTDLHVAGDGGSNVDLTVEGKIHSNDNEGGLWIGSGRFAGGDDAGNLGLKNNGQWGMTIQPDGNVGIGTAEPTEKLEVAGNVKLSSSGSLVFSDNSTLSSARLDEPAESVANPANVLLNADSDGTGSEGITMQTGGNTRVVLNNDGQLGVGTLIPASMLDISGDINFTGNILKNGVPLTTSAWNSSGSDIYYSDGSIGVNTSIPGNILEINGSLNVTSLYKNGENYSGSPWVFWDPDNSYCIYHAGTINVGLNVYSNSWEDYQPYANSANALNTRDLHSAGGWGIHGTFSDMGGGIMVRRSGYVNESYIGSNTTYWGSIQANYLYAISQHQSSDRRTKQNITSVENGLGLILQLRGRKYDLNTDIHPLFLHNTSSQSENPNDKLGYIAQELQEILPVMVEPDENDEFLMIRNYEFLYPYVASAIQELDQQNQELESRLEMIKTRIARLKEEK